MICKSFDKDAACSAPATVTVFWPGQTTVACDRHLAGMKRLAAAMGFAFDTRPMEAEAPKAEGGGA